MTELSNRILFVQRVRSLKDVIVKIYINDNTHQHCLSRVDSDKSNVDLDVNHIQRLKKI